MEDDYDMVPHNEILNLKKQINDLKSSGSSGPKNTMQELIASMNRMNEILKEAAQGMKTEESQALNLNEKMGSLLDKLDNVVEENKKIAESMITLAELIKERFPAPPRAQHPQARPPSLGLMPPQRMQGPQARMPPPMPWPQRTMPPPGHLPPLPRLGDEQIPPFPEIGQKKGLFGKFRK